MKRTLNDHTVDSMWDIIISSRELKKAISNRCDELGITVRQAVHYAGISVSNFLYRFWYRKKRKAYVKENIHQIDVIRVCNAIGIYPRLTIVVKPIDEDLKMKAKLIKEHGEIRIRKKKEATKKPK